MAGIEYFLVVATFLYIAIFSKLSFIASKSVGFSFRIIPIDSPESPLYNENLTQDERMERMIQFADYKAEQLKLHYTSNASAGDMKYLTPLDRQNSYYIGRMNIGTPSQIVYLVIDTGSGLIWTQCKPCHNCFPEVNSIFDPQVSSTYTSLPCEHQRCIQDDGRNIFRCVDGKCVYNMRYGVGNGPTIGVFSHESFRFLVDTDGHTEEFTVFFGCSNDNTNFQFPLQNNKISGILGLDLSPESLFIQLSDLIGNIFSYCIVPLAEDYPYQVHPTLLRFGDDVVIPPGNIPRTHYYTNYLSNQYYLTCLDISVGDDRIGLPAGTFNPNFGTGFFIDSGAPLTTLTTRAMNGINVYQWVMTKFRDHYTSYGLVRVPPSESPSNFKLCYRNRAGFTNFPTMTFHFEGADYTIQGIYMKIHFARQDCFCVSISGQPSAESVLGAFHMQNMRIIHNGNINAIHFYQVNCAHDHL